MGVGVHFRAKREQLKRFQVLLPESQGHNLAVNVLHVPYLRTPPASSEAHAACFFYIITLSSLELSDTKAYEP